MVIKEKIKKKLPKPILHFARTIYSKSYRLNGEKRHYFGELNKGKKFYVFRIDRAAWGVFTIIFDAIIPKMEELINDGYIPVFDFQNYRPPMMEDNITHNLWYRYFEKSDDFFELNEVYKSQYVVLAGINITYGSIKRHSNEGLTFFNSDINRRIFNTYMRPSQEILDKVLEIENELFLTGDKVLGMAVRECYRYVALINDGRLLGHPVVLSIEKQIQIAEDYMAAWNCNKLFLMIDDREGLNKFSDHFGKRLIVYNHPLAHFFHEGEPVFGDQISMELNGNAGDRLIDYLVDVELLAKCNCILSSFSSGLEAALLRNNGNYEQCEIMDLGVYTEDNRTMK